MGFFFVRVVFNFWICFNIFFILWRCCKSWYVMILFVLFCICFFIWLSFFVIVFNWLVNCLKLFDDMFWIIVLIWVFNFLILFEEVFWVDWEFWDCFIWNWWCFNIWLIFFCVKIKWLYLFFFIVRFNCCVIWIIVFGLIFNFFVINGVLYFKIIFFIYILLNDFELWSKFFFSVIKEVWNW